MTMKQTHLIALLLLGSSPYIHANKKTASATPNAQESSKKSDTKKGATPIRKGSNKKTPDATGGFFGKETLETIGKGVGTFAKDIGDAVEARNRAIENRQADMADGIDKLEKAIRDYETKQATYQKEFAEYPAKREAWLNSSHRSSVPYPEMPIAPQFGNNSWVGVSFTDGSSRTAYVHSVEEARRELVKLKSKQEEYKKTAEDERQRNNKLRDQFDAIAVDGTKQAQEVLMKAADNHLNGEQKLKENAVKAAAEQKGETDRTRARLEAFYNFINNRDNLVKIGGFSVLTAGGIFALYQLAKVGANYLESILGKPNLVRETSRVSVMQRLKNIFVGKGKKPSIDEVKLDPMLKDRLTEIAQATKAAHEHGDPFMNLLLYGPPGTGKTMFAKRLAYFANLDYAMMSGADFSQFKDGDDIVELHKLFDWAEQSSKGLLVFIDEADSFLADRGRASTSQKSINLTNAFLSRVEKQTSNKIMFIFATNHPEILDSAVNSRIGDKVKFQLPDAEIRTEIFDMYVKKYLIDQGFDIDNSVIQRKQELIAAMNGFSGRQIDGCVTKMIRAMRIKEITLLTFDIALAVINREKQQG